MNPFKGKMIVVGRKIERRWGGGQAYGVRYDGGIAMSAY